MAQTDYSTATPLPDDAEEDADSKLLNENAEGRIVTKDMAEVKYNAGDLRNGDARVEIPDTVRTFTGLTKEELRKYAEDPFWIRLRWITFVLFWLLWLAMLAGAVAIIVRSPKCAPLKWYQRGAFVEVADDADLSVMLQTAERAQAAAVVLPESLLGDVYAEHLDLEKLKTIVNEAAKIQVKVVLDVTPNYVSKSHKWFEQSEKKVKNYTDYFLWRNEQGADGVKPSPPPEDTESLNLPSKTNESWKWSDARKAYYHQHTLATEMSDLNFTNDEVKEHFRSVLRRLFDAGIDGVRLLRVTSLRLDDLDQGELDIHQHSKTSGHLKLNGLLEDWRQLAEAHKPDALVCLGGPIPESYLHGERAETKGPALPLPPVAISLSDSADQIASRINRMLRHWPAIKLTGSGAETGAAFALSLPATPVLAWRQAPDDAYNRTVALRRKQLALSDAAFADVGHVGGDILATQWSGNNEHYLGLYNIRALNMTVDITVLKNVSDTVVPYGTANELSSKTLLVPSGFSVYVNKPAGLQ